MTTTIFERIFLPARPDVLYDTYLDPVRHSQIIGAAVTISARSGTPFTAFDGHVRGRTVYLAPGKLIVQQWGSDELGDGHHIVLAFDPVADGTELSLVHSGIPAERLNRVDWEGRYWRPWRTLIESAAARGPFSGDSAVPGAAAPGPGHLER